MNESYKLSKLNPEKRAAREAAIKRVAERCNLSAAGLMCGRKGERIFVSVRGTGNVLAAAPTESEIK